MYFKTDFNFPWKGGYKSSYKFSYKYKAELCFHTSTNLLTNRRFVLVRSFVTPSVKGLQISDLYESRFYCVKLSKKLCTCIGATKRIVAKANRVTNLRGEPMSLHTKRSFVRKGHVQNYVLYYQKFVKKAFLYAGLQAEPRQKENFRRKGIQKERTNNVLSGEVFKESFTDILQTSLEQIGFSLESHNQKFSKTLTKQTFVKSALWKNLQNRTNRRFPYFTPLFSSFLFRFPQKQAKTKNKSSFFPCSLQVSNLYNHSLQALRNQAKAREGNRNDFKKARTLSKTLLDNNESPYVARTSTNRRFVTPRAMGVQIYDLFAKLCTSKAHPFGVRFNSHILIAKSRKKLWLTKLAPSQEYGKRIDARPNKIALTIKIGDYLASGDIIGEKRFHKKRVLQNDTSLFSHRPKFFEQKRPPYEVKARTNFLAKRSKPLCPVRELNLREPSTGHVKGEILVSQKETKRQKISTPIILGFSGRVVTISKTQVVVQKTQPVLFYKSANLHVKKGNWVKQGSPILTLTHQTLITGDIVQGIPRIEQLFEAFTSPPPAFKDKGDFTKFKDGYNTLHSQVRDIFRNNWLKNRLPIAVRKSLEEIGYILVEMIQKVYLSQGVLISDKHIEIIVRQIASKGQILDSGSTGLFLEEVLPIRQIENANLTTPGKKCLYVPAVMGLTAAALNSDSFISAASFQETTRVLSRDAVVGKSDFLRGLKEKVVIGDLISAGTGLDLYFIYTTMLTT